jgi:iduronate 2-sulfatase
VGFLKPHLPFVAPKKYWDLYRPEDMHPAPNSSMPQDAPDYAGHSSGELRQYHGIPRTGPLSAEQARSMVHGYHAALSYMDAQVGRLLAALEESGAARNTVVVLWGDHGWQLGEHGMWCKHTNYETSTHAPLIVAAPGLAPVKTDGLVEFVDIYPSLADLCGLPAPEGVEGVSFRPLMAAPRRAWKKAAFSQYPRNVAGMGPGMGYSVRTDRWRLVEWSPRRNPDLKEYELYDHRADPQENVNLARRPEHAETLRELTATLRAGWKAAVP